ncbi:hypothetical protein KAT24_02670 [Candidatus Pacearchaeota archaeon]|nr:hypothetical protein [Candidatus Pacearchaeota archaeon]
MAKEIISLKGILERSPNLTIADLQELQRTYDKRFVASKFTGFDKVRHTYAHMGKLMGRLADYIEALEEKREFSSEDIKNKVIPDLLVYSAWLAEEFGVNMEQVYLSRFAGNLRRLYSDKIPPQELEGLEQEVNKRLDTSE